MSMGEVWVEGSWVNGAWVDGSWAEAGAAATPGKSINSGIIADITPPVEYDLDDKRNQPIT